jgi:hypothetical protein
MVPMFYKDSLSHTIANIEKQVDHLDLPRPNALLSRMQEWFYDCEDPLESTLSNGKHCNTHTRLPSIDQDGDLTNVKHFKRFFIQRLEVLF